MYYLVAWICTLQQRTRHTEFRVYMVLLLRELRCDDCMLDGLENDIQDRVARLQAHCPEVTGLGVCFSCRLIDL